MWHQLIKPSGHTGAVPGGWTPSRANGGVDNDAPIGVNGPERPRAAKVTGAGHSGLKGLRSLRDGLRPPLTREPLPPPGRVCIGLGATEQTVAPVVGGRWAEAWGLPAGRSLSCRGLPVEPGFVAVVGSLRRDEGPRVCGRVQPSYANVRP